MNYTVIKSRSEFNTERNNVVKTVSGGLIPEYTDIPHLTEEKIVQIDRMTRHNIALQYFKDTFDAAEGVSKFKAVWYQAPSPYHVIVSRVYYSEEYQNICCDKKKAVDAFIQSSTPTQIQQFLEEHPTVTSEQDTLTITITD